MTDVLALADWMFPDGLGVGGRGVAAVPGPGLVADTLEFPGILEADAPAAVPAPVLDPVVPRGCGTREKTALIGTGSARPGPLPS